MQWVTRPTVTSMAMKNSTLHARISGFAALETLLLLSVVGLLQAGADSTALTIIQIVAYGHVVYLVRLFVAQGELLSEYVPRAGLVMLASAQLALVLHLLGLLDVVALLKWLC